MLPVNQFILSGDPLFNSGNLSEQIQYLEEQKRIIDARQKQIQQVANGQQILPTQQQPQVSVWDLIDSEIEPLTTEQRNMLANNEEYVNNYNSLQAMVQTEVLNLVRAKIEGSPEGKALLMRMLGVGEDERYEYGDEHFNKQEAKQTVDEMYHVKDGKKYIGEKYDMQKAHEVCNKFKDKLEEDIEVADVYVAINAQYHDYCELFEKWFGKGNFDEMVFESAIAFWFDDVDFGEDKLWKYFNELK